jgi:hypothetical protein
MDGGWVGSDQPISMTSVSIFAWSGGHNSARSSGVPAPLFLSSEPPPIHVFCQTQHLRHFLRGRLSSPFLHLSHPISGHHKICRSPTRWHGSVIHSFPPLNPAHPLQGAFGLVWYVHESPFPLIPQISFPVPQRISSQAHPLPSRRS